MLDLWWWHTAVHPHDWCAARAHWLDGQARSPAAGSEALVSQLFRRELLSRYCDVAPERLVFERGPKGKPSVTASRVHFSLAHAAGWHLLLVSDAPCGVDVEPWDRDLSRLRRSGAIQRFAEAATLDATGSNADLLRCWTMKEAWAKLQGLSIWDVLAKPLERDEPGWRVPQLASGQVNVGACCSWAAVNESCLRLCKF